MILPLSLGLTHLQEKRLSLQVRYATICREKHALPEKERIPAFFKPPKGQPYSFSHLEPLRDNQALSVAQSHSSAYAVRKRYLDCSSVKLLLSFHAVQNPFGPRTR